MFITIMIIAVMMLLLSKTNIGKRILNMTMVLAMGAGNLNTNVTTQTGAGQDLSPEMKTYYDKNLIRYAKPHLVHNQFGQQKPIPKKGGKTIEFRRRDPLPKALVALTEGVTPDGRKMEVKSQTATVKQFGDYITTSDVLELTAIDPVINENVKDLSDQAGRTLDTVTRDIINMGTNVQYGVGTKKARYLLVGADGTPANNDYLSVTAIKNAAKTLKRYLAKKKGDSYVAIIHPDVSYHLTDDPKWQAVTNYAPTNFYNGEIGKIEGVRFVETTEAKIFHAEDLTAGARALTVKTTLDTPGKTVAVDELITSDDATAIVGRKVILGTALYTIASVSAAAAGSATITTAEDVSVANGTKANKAYPGEAGALGRDVYSTLVIGEDAYGVTKIDGGGLETIVKAKGSAGTGDPLNQRATQGWKAIQGATILTEPYMVRIETCTLENDFGGGNN